MTRSHASAAVLGTSAALAATFLAQPASTFAATRNARANSQVSATHRAHAGAAMRSLAQHGARDTSPLDPRTVTIAVCHDCAPSRAVVRVLLRQQRSDPPHPPLRLLADRTWPALDTLAHRSRSQVVLINRLAERVGVTPAAIGTSHPAPAVGVHEVLALLAHRPVNPRGGTR